MPYADHFSACTNYGFLTELIRSCDLFPSLIEFLPYLGYDLTGRFYLIYIGGYLAYFQFAFLQVAFEHAFFGATATEEALQFFYRCAALFGGLYFLKEA